MEDTYSDNFSKIALAATSAKLAKIVCVQEYGLGEDLTFNFMGWNEGDMSIVCQMSKETMLLTPNERLRKSGALCSILRRYWGVTAITMVAEGYCSLDPENIPNVELSKAYIDPESGVEECITLTHAEIVDGVIEVNLVALPYTYQLGREVTWFEMLIYPTKAQKVLKNSKYPTMLESVLAESTEQEVNPEAYDELRSVIAHNGFYIQEFF